MRAHVQAVMRSVQVNNNTDLLRTDAGEEVTMEELKVSLGPLMSDSASHEDILASMQKDIGAMLREEVGRDFTVAPPAENTRHPQSNPGEPERRAAEQFQSCSGPGRKMPRSFAAQGSGSPYTATASVRGRTGRIIREKCKLNSANAGYPGPRPDRGAQGPAPRSPPSTGPPSTTQAARLST